MEPSPLGSNIETALPVLGSDEGVAFLFVLDTSGSVKGVPFERFKESAWKFIELMGANDRGGIMTFDDSAQLVVPPVSERQLLRQEINKIQIRGRLTVLYDALTLAVDLIKRENRKSSFLIVFSDGKDEGSRSTLQEVIHKIRLSEVSVLCVGYSRVETEYLDILRTIAAETGGVFADAPLFHDLVALYETAQHLDSRN
jgi:Ca-activated chloride channel family protein